MAVILVLVSAAVYLSNLRYVGSFDSLSARLLPFNILRGDGLILDRLAFHDPVYGYSFHLSTSGHWVSSYPIATPLLATPIYFLVNLIAPFDVDGPNKRVLRVGMEKLSAALIAGLSVAILFLVLSRLTARRVAVLLSLLFAFGTPTWVISSQSFFPHGMANLLLTIALFLLAQPRPTTSHVVVLGLLAGLITANRPTDIVFSVALAWIAWRKWGHRAVLFAAPAAIIAAGLLAYNIHNFATPLGGYGVLNDERSLSNNIFANPGWPGIAALLVSNRGLLVFCPFLNFLFLFKWKDSERVAGIHTLLVAWLAQLALFATSDYWYGGTVYGPRYLTDGLPILMVALARPVEEALKSRVGRACLALTAIWAVGLQAIGAYCSIGEHGSGSHGFWNLSHSAPVLAAKAGLAPPDFLPIIASRLTMNHALTPGEARASYAWLERPEQVWLSRQEHDVRVRVRNEGTTYWSSLGGWFNRGAIRLTGSWQAEGSPITFPIKLPSQWLTVRLWPDRWVTRAFPVIAPNAPGHYRLAIQVEQDGVPFEVHGVPALIADVVVVPSPRLDRARSIEWLRVSGPPEVESGGIARYDLVFRNSSREPWKKETYVSYHWLTGDGRSVVEDGLRSTRGSLQSGAVVTMKIRVLANVKPGDYVLAFDAVEEGVTWFEQDGSEPFRMRVRVR